MATSLVPLMKVKKKLIPGAGSANIWKKKDVEDMISLILMRHSSSFMA